MDLEHMTVASYLGVFNWLSFKVTEGIGLEVIKPAEVFHLAVTSNLPLSAHQRRARTAVSTGARISCAARGLWVRSCERDGARRLIPWAEELAVAHMPACITVSAA